MGRTRRAFRGAYLARNPALHGAALGSAIAFLTATFFASGAFGHASDHPAHPAHPSHPTHPTHPPHPGHPNGPWWEHPWSVKKEHHRNFHHVPGIGPARATHSDLLAVRLPDGDVITTHGGDPTPEANPSATDLFAESVPTSAKTSGSGSTKWHPRCVRAPSRRFHVLYASPSGATADRLTMSHIRGVVSTMDQRMSRAAKQSSRVKTHIHYKFSCNRRHAVRVSAFNPRMTRNREASFANLVGDAVDAGHAKPSEKYLIFYDGNVDGYCGVGEIWNDDRRSRSNLNDLGPSYAALFGRQCWNASLGLHETGHTMGAVQHSAPHATAGWHCYDRRDVMCYDDGSPDYESGIEPCTVLSYDCRYGDYFDARTARGYLKSHWNIGWSGNRFLRIR